MKAVIVGYGKMGKAIERIAKEQGIEVIRRLDPNGGDFPSITPQSVEGADVAFEFTSPETAVENILALCECRVNCVVGSTGWYGRLDEVRGAVEKSGIGCVYSPNFSVGMNLFFRLVSEAARLYAPIADARFGLEETHHETKKDAPSGTALKIAEVMRESGAKLERGSITALRVGYVPGIHSVVIDLPYETVTLNHSVRQREVFAYGAVLAAKLLVNRKGLISFSQLLTESLKM